MPFLEYETKNFGTLSIPFGPLVSEMTALKHQMAVLRKNREDIFSLP